MPFRTGTALFFMITLFLSAWHIDTSNNDSVISRAALTTAIVEHGTVCIDAYHEGLGDKALVDGHYYSDKAPLPALAMAPIWWCVYRLGLVTPGPRGLLTDGLKALGGVLCGSLPFALIITMLWLRGRRCGWSARLGSPLTIVLPLFGSFLFLYSGTFYNHIAGAYFILSSTFALEDDRPVAAGLWASAALLTDTALAILVAVQLLQFVLSNRWKVFFRIACGLLPGVLGLIGWNLVITGAPFSFPAAHAANFPEMHFAVGFGASFFAALPQLLLGDYRGLFIYMPALFSLFFIRYRFGWKALMLDPFVLPAIGLILAYSTHAYWWGGWANGPRYLSTPALLLLVFTITHLRASRVANGMLLLTSAFGCLLAFMAKCTTGYGLPTEVKHPLTERVLPAFLHGAYTDAQWPVWCGLSPGASTALFLVAFLGGLFALSHIDDHLVTAA
jgi:hypothetical protein